jgi:hypothetical protein
MKNGIIVFFILAALVVFCGSSPWEGAAATAPVGELPSSGLYVATNSFPKNTVVDIINIENNKSTRVIVASGLDSPGLLAIVSLEAAELIGMRPGSVSRIRMTQPSDPIAYLRFTENMAAGIPAFDSGNVVTEETYNPEEDYFFEAVNEPPAARSPAPVNTPIASAPAASTPASRPGSDVPYFLEPEWGGAASSRNIIDLPEYIAEEVEEYPYEEIAEETPEEIYEEIAEAEPEEELYEEVVEAEPEEAYEEIFEPAAEIAEAEEPVEYNMVPADERPPGSIYGIDPADIIPGISRAPEPEPEMTFIPEIAPAISAPPVVASTEPSFSIPRIYELSRGSYYVQVAAFDTAESVEYAVSNIDYHYEPKVYKDGDHWYRVLLGPLNQGESAAILARFKSIGYKDAFVRLAR